MAWCFYLVNRGGVLFRSLLGRAVRSAHNRTDLAQKRMRGLALRAAYPGVLAGGSGLLVGQHVALALYGSLRLGSHVTLSDGCAIEVGPGASLELGDGVFVGRSTVIVAQGNLRIGNGTLIAEHCTIRDQDHHVVPEERANEDRHIVSDTVLGRNVWLGAGVRVLRGTTVGDETVVAANSVVRGVVPPRVVVAGVPARVVRAIPVPGQPANKDR